MTEYKDGVPSPYYFDILTAVQGLAGEGVKVASQYDITSRAGKSINASFRKAMKELEYQGAVTKKRMYSNLGGLMVVYELHLADMQLPMNAPAF